MNGGGLPALTALVDCLKSTEGELTLDLACSRRIEAGTLSALQTLAERAGEKQVGVVLTGVSVDVYRVLKLLRLAHRFTFLA
jgi:anti-anti-sigma regulatory factor